MAVASQVKEQRSNLPMPTNDYCEQLRREVQLPTIISAPQLKNLDKVFRVEQAKLADTTHRAAKMISSFISQRENLVRGFSIEKLLDTTHLTTTMRPLSNGGGGPPPESKTCTSRFATFSGACIDSSAGGSPDSNNYNILKIIAFVGFVFTMGFIMYRIYSEYSEVKPWSKFH